jgi:hypothetical protein
MESSIAAIEDSVLLTPEGKGLQRCVAIEDMGRVLNRIRNLASSNV